MLILRFEIQGRGAIEDLIVHIIVLILRLPRSKEQQAQGLLMS
jgi:hypothetical protein